MTSHPQHHLHVQQETKSFGSLSSPGSKQADQTLLVHWGGIQAQGGNLYDAIGHPHCSWTRKNRPMNSGCNQIVEDAVEYAIVVIAE